MLFKITLVLSLRAGGGFIVTSHVEPELVTEGERVEEAMDTVRHALAAVVEAFQDLGRPLPPQLQLRDTESSPGLDTAVAEP